MAAIRSVIVERASSTLSRFMRGNFDPETASPEAVVRNSSALSFCRTYSTAAYFSQCTDATPSGNLLDFTYGYNFGSSDNGNVATWSSVGSQTFTRSYAYDALNRISTMSDTAASQTCKGLSWTVDAWGNLTDQNVTSGSCQTLHVGAGTNNRLTSPFQYDAAGNMTNDGTHAYSYDAENHLTQVDGGSTASYIYDPNGRRVRKNSGGSWTEYFYDVAGNVTAEKNPSTWPVKYVYLFGQLIAQYRDNTTYSIFRDHLGSTRLITRLDKSVYDSLDFLPFGVQTAGNTGTTHKFTGKERDAESGLDYFSARFDSSNLGRFTTPDTAPLGPDNPQALNRYTYVLNNPLRYIDPNGEDPQEFVDGLWRVYAELKYEWGRELPYVTQATLSAITARNAAHAIYGAGELVGGSVVGVFGAAAAVVTRNPVWLGMTALGGYFAYQGYEHLENTSNDEAELLTAIAVQKFETGVDSLLSQLNATTVRDFSIQQLWDSKLAAQSIFDQHLLPLQLLDQIRNTIWLLEAELERRRRELLKLLETNCKGDGGASGGASCQRPRLD